MFYGLVGKGLSYYGNTNTAEKFDNILSLATVNLQFYTVDDVY